MSSNSNSVASKFKYNGVEHEEALGIDLYEMPLRQYDPAIARWTSIDPVTHYSMSTYTAFDNNPVFWADPSGADSYSYDWDAHDRGETGVYTNNTTGESTTDWETAINGGKGEEKDSSIGIKLPNIGNINNELKKSSSGCQNGGCYDPVDFKNDSAEVIYNKLINNLITFVNEKNESIRTGSTTSLGVYIEHFIRLDNIYGDTEKTSGSIIDQTINFNGSEIRIIALPVTGDPIVSYDFKGADKKMNGTALYYTFDVYLKGKYRNKVKGWESTGFRPKMLQLRFSSKEQYDSFVKEIKKSLD